MHRSFVTSLVTLGLAFTVGCSSSPADEVTVTAPDAGEETTSVDTGSPDTAVASETGEDAAPEAGEDAAPDTAIVDTGADVVDTAKPPACDDGMKNGSETDLDCGGSCLKCADAKACAVAADCVSGVCTSNICVAPACNDGVKNGGETDADCGGSCGKCADAKACAVATDCISGVCTGNVCIAPKCDDGVKNSVETDADCGGGTCPSCALAKACSVDTDCASGRCDANVCSRHILAVSAANLHSCAILYPGKVKCWGLAAAGRIGYGNTTNKGGGATDMASLGYVDLGTGHTAKAISTNGHTCAILDDNSVKCWGLNANGQLGLGDASNRGDDATEMGDALVAVALGTGRTAKQIYAGEAHSCALLDDGSLKCWGLNGRGQLGLGDTNSRGDNAGEMGDALPAIDLGTGRKAIQVSLAHEATCALLDNARIKCWGSGEYYLGGRGNNTDVGKASGQMGDALPYVDLGTGRTAKYLTTGYAHACAILDDDTVKCWGYNADSRLGLGDTNHRGDSAGEMGDALPTVSLGTGLVPTKLVAGGSQTCAQFSTGAIKCWGLGSAFLGQGDTVTRGTALTQMGDALPFVSLGSGLTPVAFTSGWNTACVTFSNDTVKCWGANNYGQLGIGDYNARGDNAGEMGDTLPTIKL